MNLKYKGNEWFDGLRIFELRLDDPNKNLYRVIHLDTKELDIASFESFLGDVRL